MDAYLFKTDLYCANCGEMLRRDITALGGAPPEPADESTYGSDVYPKGPRANGWGVAHCPQHCHMCGIFLQNPITDEGREYVRQCVENVWDYSREIVETWIAFYRID